MRFFNSNKYVIISMSLIYGIAYSLLWILNNGNLNTYILFGFLSAFSICILIFFWYRDNRTQMEKSNLTEQLAQEINSKQVIQQSLDDAIFVHKQYRRRSKAIYGSLIDSSPQIIFRIDCFERVLFVNKAFFKYFNIDSCDLMGKNIYESFPKDLASQFKISDKKLLSSGDMVEDIVEYVSELSTEKRYMELFKMPITNNSCEIVGIQCVCWDITNRKKAEIELKEAELKFRTLVENSLAGVYILQNQELKYVNPMFASIFGFSQEEMLDSFQINAIIDSVDLKQIEEIHRNLLNQQLERFRYELKGVKKDGQNVSVEVFDSITYYMGQMAIIGTVIDITERKNHEQQLLNLYDETSSQNKRLKNFAYIVSHNIRSQTANISGLVDCLYANDSEEMRGELYSMLKATSEKLEDTILDLNEITTIQSDNYKHKSSIFIRKEVDQICNDIQSLIQQTNTEIINDIPEDFILNVIPSYFESIMLNLLSNGIKYRSSLRNPMIKISVEEIGHEIVLSIKDNGIGIDMIKNKDKIFGMYKTFLNSSESRGFGLYITKNQIEAMNGKIEVDSELGVGSTFKITFYGEN